MSNGIKNGPGLSVSQIRDLFFPVGVKVTSRVSPASLIGGTWELAEEGRTIVAAGAKYQAGSAGGEEKVTLYAGNIPSLIAKYGATNITSDLKNGYIVTGDYNAYVDLKIRVNEESPNYPHNNMPPYISEYIWTRIA